MLRSLAPQLRLSYGTWQLHVSRILHTPRVYRTFPLCRQQLERRIFSSESLSARELKVLEREANRYPSDAARQLPFFRALARDYPHHAIRRFESGSFAENSEIRRMYDTAVSASRPRGSFVPQSVASNSRESSLGSLQKVLNGNSASAPLQVAVREEGAKSQFWKTVRSLGGMFLFITGIGAIIDSAGGGGALGVRGTGMFAEVKEADASDKSFDDIKGCTEAKDELREIVEFLQDPSRFTRLGGKLPKGVLLMGAPGTGKTLLARAVAGEAGVPFFYCSGSEFEEMYVGVGARRVRELFTAAKKASPCIIFIDEVDAIGGTRKMKDHQAMRMTLNQLLVELDGFKPNDGIIVIGATNFPELLDKALIRPGRFDRQVIVPLPDLNGRKEILDLYISRIECSQSVDMLVLARGTPGCSGAQLDNLVNMAAIKASQENLKEVTMKELEWAKDRILMGAERRSAVMSDDDKKLTAYHEGGHALVALLTDGAHPIHKATIMPRGNALGMVHLMPEKDEYSVTRKQLLAQLDVCMGGRVAEEMIFGAGGVTTGASSDLKSATRVAKSMVMKWGMSERVGPIDYDEREITELSPETRQIIDNEICLILEASKKRASTLLQKRSEDLHKLAKALIEYETLSREEIKCVLAGEKIERKF